MEKKASLTVVVFVSLLSGCNTQTQPEYHRSVPWTQFSPWLVADLHTHSHFSDGSLSAGDLIEEAVMAGCEVVALTDHSDMIKQVTTATPVYFNALDQLRQQHP